MTQVKRQALLLAVAMAMTLGMVRAKVVQRVATMRQDPQQGGALETAVITAVLLGAAIWIGAKVTTAVHTHGNAIK